MNETETCKTCYALILFEYRSEHESWHRKEERMIWGSLANLGKVSVRFVKNSRPSDAARTFLPTLARTLQRWKRRSKPLNGKPNHRNVWKRNVSNLDMNQERIEPSY